MSEVDEMGPLGLQSSEDVPEIVDALEIAKAIGLKGRDMQAMLRHGLEHVVAEEKIERGRLAEASNPAPVDPVQQDPAEVENPEDLTERLMARHSELKSRRNARDWQVAVLRLEDELKTSAADIHETNKVPQPEMTPPADLADATDLVARLLTKCEEGMVKIIGDGGKIAEFGKASQLAHAAANLARTYGNIAARPGSEKKS